MRSVRCPECGREFELSETAKSGNIIDCPFCAGLSLRLIEEGGRLSTVAPKRVSCPACDRIIVPSDNAHAGDIIRCCGKEFRLTYEFGSFAMEGLVRAGPKAVKDYERAMKKKQKQGPIPGRIEIDN